MREEERKKSKEEADAFHEQLQRLEDENSHLKLELQVGLAFLGRGIPCLKPLVISFVRPVLSSSCFFCLLLLLVLQSSATGLLITSSPASL